MPIISHRCRCGDLDFHHWPSNVGRLGQCGNLACRSKCQGFQANTALGPEVIPTFTLDGQDSAEVIEPGQTWNSGIGVHAFTTCSCEECRELYAQAVG